MSVHPSLKTKGSVGEKRNVMKRYERIDQLKKEGAEKGRPLQRWRQGLGPPEDEACGISIHRYPMS